MKDKNQIIQGLEYSMSLLDNIELSGVSNFKKLTTVYNNMEVILNMFINGELEITNHENTQKDIKKTSKSNNQKG